LEEGNVMKNLVLISYLQDLFKQYKVKAEFSTNDKDDRVIVVQEQPGQKIVFYGDIEPLYNYFQVNVYGLTIKENYETANSIGNLIGKHIQYDYDGKRWQIIFKQYSNPQAIEYLDIRRVGYTATLQVIINPVLEIEA
jgi:hypothetical protein